MSEIKFLAEGADGRVTVSHVADFYRRYPGESVTFYTRLEVHETVSGLTLKVSLPNEIELGDYTVCSGREPCLPAVRTDDLGHHLIWSLEGALQAGDRYEYRVQGRIEPLTPTALESAVYLESQALVDTGDGSVLDEETTTVAVFTKGKYLQYMPALYDQDDFMSRFVMLFESFWAPLETQIDGVHVYFDPKLTPPAFLPWLASWLDLELDERWALNRRRQLIRWAIALHRSRGTKWGLKKYLEIYTGQKPTIIEHRAENFRLGSEARLGPGIALGRDNVPHTFSVTLRLPPVDSAKDDQERAYREKMRRQTIESIIEMQKPAHTLYTLNIEPLVSSEAESQVDVEETLPAEEEESSIWFKLDD